MPYISLNIIISTLEEVIFNTIGICNIPLRFQAIESVSITFHQASIAFPFL